ncbi:MAG: ATP-binding cassette domain-containing protein, partial [Candidatus Phosphoribacter sp.]
MPDRPAYPASLTSAEEPTMATPVTESTLQADAPAVDEAPPQQRAVPASEPEAYSPPNVSIGSVAEGRELDESSRAVLTCHDVSIYYGAFRAVNQVTMDVRTHEITALIGPSGCGKSTVLRSLNRMNDLIVGSRVTGTIAYHGTDIYSRGVDPIEVRRRIG